MFYTKYRPQRFSDIQKPNEVVDGLLSQIKSGKVAHAYLFVGPRGTGKTTIARLLAKSLNCKKPLKSGDPCDKCSACEAIKSGSYIDLVEIDAASNRGIDDIRELREKVRLAPAAGGKKVYIVDEVHMLSQDAFNAFLKTLEEPPKNVVFILCTTEFHKVPATIKSRCQIFRIKRASVEQLIAKLSEIAKAEKFKINDDDIKKIAKASAGGYRDAETLLQQVIEGGVSVDVLLSVGAKYKFSDFVNMLVECKCPEALSYINGLFDEGMDLYVWTGEFLHYLRGLIFVKSGVSTEIEVEDVAVELSWVRQVAEVFMAAQSEVRASFIPQLPLELAVVKLCEDTAGDSGGRQNGSNPPSKSVHPGGIRFSSDKGVSKPAVPHDQISEKWQTIIGETSKVNSSLAALLKNTNPIGVNGKYVILEVCYSFHKERLESTRNRTILEGVLKDLFKKSISLQCTVNKENRPKKKLTPSEVGELTDRNVAPAGY
jgi:DNA polymerase-3 subunit gamma/tau